MFLLWWAEVGHDKMLTYPVDSEPVPVVVWPEPHIGNDHQNAVSSSEMAHCSLRTWLLHVMTHTENVESLVVLLDTTSVSHNTALAVSTSAPTLTRSHMCGLWSSLLQPCSWCSSAHERPYGIQASPMCQSPNEILSLLLPAEACMHSHCRTTISIPNLPETFQDRGCWTTIFCHCRAMRFCGIVVSATRNSRCPVICMYICESTQETDRPECRIRFSYSISLKSQMQVHSRNDQAVEETLQFEFSIAIAIYDHDEVAKWVCCDQQFIYFFQLPTTQD